MKALAMSMIAAPLFLVASAIVSPELKSDEGAQLSVIAAHPSRWYWFTLLLLIGSLLLVPALAGIAALIYQQAPRLATIAGSLAVLGSLIAIGDVMSQFVTWQMVAGGADRTQMAALLHRYDNAAGAGVVFGIGGLSVVVGTLLLTIGLIRTRVAPTWAAAGLSVAILLNLVTFSSSSGPGVTLSWIVLLVAMGYLGRCVLAGSGRYGIAVDSARPHVAAS